MRKIRDVLRLSWEKNLSPRKIAKSCSVARATVQDYLKRAEQSGLNWPEASALDDTALEQRLYAPRGPEPGLSKSLPSMDYLYREMRRSGVTLQLLWYEYKQHHPPGYQYSYFCEQYRNYVKKLDPVFRHHHRAGEKMFVDYAGQTVEIIDKETGQVSKACLFVATLGASNYTYAEAFAAQDLPGWIAGHVHAFKFFGGVPEIVVPDNLKAGRGQHPQARPGPAIPF